MIGSSYTLRTTINQFLLINNWYYDCASFRWVELSSRPEDSVMQSSSKLSFGVDEYQLHSREVDSSMIPWDIWLLPSSGILWKCVGILMIAEGIPAECHGALLETIKGGERERERNKEREREGWGGKRWNGWMAGGNLQTCSRCRQWMRHQSSPVNNLRSSGKANNKQIAIRWSGNTGSLQRLEASND